MITAYETALFEICQTLTGKLSFTHYCDLFTVSDKSARAFYEKEAINSNWSVRELKRQIDTSLFERLLLSEGNANKEKVLSLAKHGITYAKPDDIFRDPYVFEFLGVPENKPMLEKDWIMEMETSKISAKTYTCPKTEEDSVF